MVGQNQLFSFSQHASLKSNKSQSKPSLRSTYNCSKTADGDKKKQEIMKSSRMEISCHYDTVKH